MARRKVAQVSVSLRLVKWLFRTMKVKESYDRPLAEIEETKRRRNSSMTFSFKPLRGQTLEMTRVCDREVVVVRNGGGASERALLYLYGGGFSSEISRIEKKASVEYGKRSGRDVWIPRYPNVMDDGITARELYQMVLETYRLMLDSYEPVDIAVIGFSAGATLGLGMFEYNNTLPEPLPVPALLIASSPACIPQTDEEVGMIQELADRDIMIPASFVRTIKEALCHGEELPGWMYEITTGDLSNMPHTHVYYGSDEVLRASAASLVAGFERAGSRCELHIGDGMFHCYPAIRLIPECRAAFDEIVEYLKS